MWSKFVTRIKREPIVTIGIGVSLYMLFKNVASGEPVAGTTFDSLVALLSSILGRSLVTPNSSIEDNTTDER